MSPFVNWSWLKENLATSGALGSYSESCCWRALQNSGKRFWNRQPVGLACSRETDLSGVEDSFRIADNSRLCIRPRNLIFAHGRDYFHSCITLSNAYQEQRKTVGPNCQSFQLTKTITARYHFHSIASRMPAPDKNCLRAEGNFRELSELAAPRRNELAWRSQSRWGTATKALAVAPERAGIESH